MEWLGKVIDLLNTPELVLAMLLASAILLFIPVSWLPGTSVTELRGKYGIVLLVFFAGSGAVLLVNGCRWAIHRGRARRTKEGRQLALVQRLSNLDGQEQIILREFTLQGRNTIKLPMEHAVVVGLCRAGILVPIQARLERCAAGRVGSFVLSQTASEFLTMDMLGLPPGPPAEQEKARVCAARPSFIREITQQERVWEW